MVQFLLGRCIPDAVRLMSERLNHAIDNQGGSIEEGGTRRSADVR